MNLRIKEIEYPNGNKSYVVERKSIFGFWYNCEQDDYSSGYFDTVEKAKEAVMWKTTPCKTKIVWENRNE